MTRSNQKTTKYMPCDTPAERADVYKEAITLLRSEEMPDDPDSGYDDISWKGMGVCEIIAVLTGRDYKPRLFREWAAQYPGAEDSFGAWWPLHDRDIREEALRVAIALCKV